MNEQEISEAILAQSSTYSGSTSDVATAASPNGSVEVVGGDVALYGGPIIDGIKTIKDRLASLPIELVLGGAKIAFNILATRFGLSEAFRDQVWIYIEAAVRELLAK